MLKNTEDAFDKAAEEAKVVWTQVLCGNSSFASSGKEMWESLNKLTTYQEYNSGGVLPLKDEEGTAVFDREESVHYWKRFSLLENTWMTVSLMSSSRRLWRSRY